MSLDSIERLIQASPVPKEDAIHVLHLFSVLPEPVRDELVSLCSEDPDLLLLFWENYKAKREAYTKKDTALWTSILETEKQAIDEATE